MLRTIATLPVLRRVLFSPSIVGTLPETQCWRARAAQRYPCRTKRWRFVHRVTVRTGFSLEYSCGAGSARRCFLCSMMAPATKSTTSVSAINTNQNTPFLSPATRVQKTKRKNAKNCNFIIWATIRIPNTLTSQSQAGWRRPMRGTNCPVDRYRVIGRTSSASSRTEHRCPVVKPIAEHSTCTSGILSTNNLKRS